MCLRPEAADKVIILLKVAEQVSQVPAKCETLPGVDDNRRATRQPRGEWL